MTDNGTVSALFNKAVEKHGPRAFLHAPEETTRLYDLVTADYTYEAAGCEIAALEGAYSRIGCRVGLRVGLALDNRPEFFLHFLALNGLGVSVLPLNSALQDKELAYQISHSECALIVSSHNHAGRLRELAGALRPTVAVVVHDNLARAPKITPSAGSGDQPLGAHTEAAVLYTSGTTGTPKACVLSNEYFRAIGDHYTGLGGLCAFEEGRDRLITPLPVTHMNALACSFTAAMQTGACLIQLDRFHPRTWWRTIRESRATIMHYLGVMPAILLKAQVEPEEDFGEQIKFGFGAGCDPRHHLAFEQRFGIPLIEAWAMTETGAGAWITASHEPRHVGARCFGRAPDGLEYKLVDEAGEEALAGAPGELLVRRAGAEPRRYFFSGYLKDEGATEEAWRGGWFHTGDVVRIGEDGAFYFVDRRKNIIRRSGENIAALEVESVLMRHAGVANCVVVPAPDEIRGEEVAALVIPARGGDRGALAEDIFDFCRNELVYYKAPGYIAFVDAIPLTASEKVNRGEAKRLARSLIESGACQDLTSLKKSSGVQGRT